MNKRLYRIYGFILWLGFAMIMIGAIISKWVLMFTGMPLMVIASIFGSKYFKQDTHKNNKA